MQMTVMSEGLLLNSKYIEMGREEEGFEAFLTQPPLVIVCYVSTNLDYEREKWGTLIFLSARRVSPFLAWGDFHACSRFARSTIPEEK